MYSNEEIKKRALKKLKSAADQGDKSAQFEMGLDYLTGWRFFERNHEEAFKWIHLSADQGHKEAQN
jgi:TPR repeat protein